MELQKIELLTVLDVLYDRIARLTSLCRRYPDVCLASDWKYEISILEKFCKDFEDSNNIKPVSDDITLLPVENK